MGYFLAVLDIVGYTGKVMRESKLLNRPVEDIRVSWLSIITKRMKELNARRSTLGFWPGIVDSWIVAFSDFSNALIGIGHLLESNLDFTVAVGFIRSDKLPSSEKSLIGSNAGPVIKSQRAEIASWSFSHRQETHEAPASGTSSILVSKEAYEEIEEDYRKICRRIDIPLQYYMLEPEKVQRKLTILRFMEKCRIPLTDLEYREIENLYVKPPNYEEIRGILDKHNIVFIVGNTGVGKTYTATKLLLDYYDRYEPLFVSEEKGTGDWDPIRQHIPKTFEGKAVCIENLFQKMREGTMQSFSKTIEALIMDAQKMDCKLIITSQPTAFERFIKRLKSPQDLVSRVQSLTVNLTYYRSTLTEILRRFTSLYTPVWAKDERLMNVVTQAADNTFSNALVIRQFILASMNMKNEEQLKSEVRILGTSPTSAFTGEIWNMFSKAEYDSLVFLSLSYIGVNLEVAKSSFCDILEKVLHTGTIRRTFEGLAKELSDWCSTSQDGRLGFIHPSYHEAFRIVLSENDRPSAICERVFSFVLERLSEKNEAAGDIASAIAKDFSILPERAQNVLFKLANVGEVSVDVAVAVDDNFDSLPTGARNRLMKSLSKWHDASRYLASIISSHFERIPSRVRTDLLLKLSNRYGARWYLAQAVVKYYDLITEVARRPLVKKLRREVLAILDGLSHSANRVEKKKVLEAVSSMSGAINKDLTLRILSTLATDEDWDVRHRADELMSALRGGSREYISTKTGAETFDIVY